MKGKHPDLRRFLPVRSDKTRKPGHQNEPTKFIVLP